MRQEYLDRLVKEYRYALERMRKEEQAARKLYYFSVFYGEAQRILNWEWDTDIVLIYTLTHYVYNQVSGAVKSPDMIKTLPVNWDIVFAKLTQTSSNLTDFLENAPKTKSREKLLSILGDFSEIAYSVSGNGSYLCEKGVLVL